MHAVTKAHPGRWSDCYSWDDHHCPNDCSIVVIDEATDMVVDHTVADINVLDDVVFDIEDSTLTISDADATCCSSITTPTASWVHTATKCVGETSTRRLDELSLSVTTKDCTNPVNGQCLCAAGLKVVGGGCTTTAGFTASWPTADGLGWECTAKAGSTIESVNAICANIDTTIKSNAGADWTSTSCDAGIHMIGVAAAAAYSLLRIRIRRGQLGFAAAAGPPNRPALCALPSRPSSSRSQRPQWA